ncbi:toxin-antitoxin system YwqK family antitoxin [Pedobacter sp. UBA5917]|jgi:antitoxin component YwqK of YwqJK toxin-antitoxin module|uniref:toxin-antitoxin system YwqK family antitoxin n=1 Tax=Pedobacter sp. UBA5917 TaxID=1947061 RepID=UPI0025CCB57F|nr:hypothetical protein [Pedobacter sp. UBA5917]
MLRINWTDPDIDIVGVDAGGGDIYYYKNMPFTGILYENHSNGNLNYEIECVNGYPEGVQRHYYENGQINQESFLKYNQEYGIMKEWDEHGNLLSEYDWGPKP